MQPTRNFIRISAFLCLVIIAPVARPSAEADQVLMRNGDRLNGNVLSLGSDQLVFRNEHVGVVKLPRAKVSSITFGEVPVAQSQPSPEATSALTTNRAAQPGSLSASLAANSNMIARVQKQFLTGAGGEAQDKFNELLSGLLSGNLTVDDIRAQARATAAQVRAARKDMDESSRFAIDGYLAILDRFLGAESSPQNATNTTGRASAPLLEDEQ